MIVFLRDLRASARESLSRCACISATATRDLRASARESLIGEDFLPIEEIVPGDDPEPEWNDIPEMPDFHDSYDYYDCAYDY